MRNEDEPVKAGLVNGKHVIAELGLVQAEPPKQETLDTYCGMPVDGDPTNENTVARNP